MPSWAVTWRPPGLAHQGADRGGRGQEGGQVGIVVRGALGVVGGAKGHQHRVGQLQLAGPLEELLIAGVGAGPTAFDVGNPQAVQLAGHLEFVFWGEDESLGLGAVPEGGVVKLDDRGVGRPDVSYQTTSSGLGVTARSSARPKASCRARTANSVYFSSITQEILISLVLMVRMLMFSAARAPNILVATPA